MGRQTRLGKDPAFRDGPAGSRDTGDGCLFLRFEGGRGCQGPTATARPPNSASRPELGAARRGGGPLRATNSRRPGSSGARFLSPSLRGVNLKLATAGLGDFSLLETRGLRGSP